MLISCLPHPLHRPCRGPGGERGKREAEGTKGTGKLPRHRCYCRHGLVESRLSPGSWDCSGSPEVQVEDRDFHFVSQPRTKMSHMFLSRPPGEGRGLAMYLFWDFCISHAWMWRGTWSLLDLYPPGNWEIEVLTMALLQACYLALSKSLPLSAPQIPHSRVLSS